MSEKYISLDNLKEYNTKVKETYIKPLEEKVDEIVTELTEDRATIEATYTNRITANDRNIKDESDVILKKVVGNTVHTSEGFKSATFSGIESKSQDGTKVDNLVFPETEVPLGTTIDFENKIISNTYAEYTFLESNTWLKNNIIKDGTFVEFYLNDTKTILKSDMTATTKIVSDRFKCISGSVDGLTENVPTFRSTNNNLCFYYPITEDRPASEINNSFIRPLIAGITLRYPTTPDNVEWYKTEPFTIEQIEAGNSYKGYLKGTETVLNEGAEFGVDSTLTQEYDISSINSRIDEIEKNIKDVATQEWMKTYIEQYIKDNFATLMAQKVTEGSLATEEVTATDGDISSIFGEEA